MAWQAAAIAAGQALMEQRSAQKHARSMGHEMANLGHALDQKHYFEREAELWKRGQERGLTPQEYYGSPAPGVGGPSGAANVLGNMATQTGVARSQIMAQLGNQMGQMALQKRGQDIDLEKTKIMAGAQKESAGISADATVYSAEIQKQIAQNRLKFDDRTYRNISLPGAQLNMQKTRKETENIINNIATSHPKFVKAMKLLSMGPENMAASMVVNAAGIDITSPESMQKVPEKKRRDVLAAMLAAGSVTRKETEGIIELITGKGGSVAEDNPSYPTLGIGTPKRQKILDLPFFKIYRDVE